MYFMKYMSTQHKVVQFQENNKFASFDVHFERNRIPGKKSQLHHIYLREGNRIAQLVSRELKKEAQTIKEKERKQTIKNVVTETNCGEDPSLRDTAKFCDKFYASV